MSFPFFFFQFFSQSKGMGYSLGHIFSSTVQIAQHFVSGAMGELGDWAASASTGWVVAGVWLDAVASASLALSVASQFLCVVGG